MPTGKPRKGTRKPRPDPGVPQSTTDAKAAERLAWQQAKVTEICEAIESGVPAIHAAPAAGIHRTTWWRWLKEREEWLHLAEVAHSKAAAAMALVLTAAATDPRGTHSVKAALEWLRARDREHWRKQLGVEVELEAGATLADLVAMSFKRGGDDSGNGSGGNGDR